MQIINRRWMLLTPGMFLLALSPMAKASFVSGQFAPGGTSVEVTGTEILFYNLGVPPPVVPTGTFAIDSLPRPGASHLWLVISPRSRT